MESDFVKLKTYPTRLYAEMVRDVLAQNHIPAYIKSDDFGIFGGGSYGSQTSISVMLWVPQQDYEKAMELADLLLNSI